MSGTQWLAFLPVAPGLEQVLRDEVKELVPGARPKLRRGGLEVRVGVEELTRLVRRCRIAESLRVRIGHFVARDFRTLEAGLARLPWDAYIARGSQPALRVRARRSKLIHTDAIAERVSRCLMSRGEGPGGPAASVHVRLDRDHVQISIEAADESLHKRGWRVDAGRAPLRENIAAACLRASGWKPGQPLWDPFCGSGTLPIEAVALAFPGLLEEESARQIQRWPIFDADAWEAVDLAATEEPTGAVAQIGGSDREPSCVDRAVHHAQRAGADDHCRFAALPVEAGLAQAPRGAGIVTNAPYGKRLRAGADLVATYEALGRALSARTDLTSVAVLVGNPDFERHTGLTWRCLLSFSNRGEPVRLLVMNSVSP